VLRLVGAGCLLIVALYLMACWKFAGRVWNWRDFRIALPPLTTGFVQLAVAAPVWLLGAASLKVLMPDVPFDILIVSLMASALAGLVIRIPAGLGVMEATLLASLGPTVGEGKLIAAMLVYRCIHYLLPLALGLLVVLAAETRISGWSRSRLSHARGA
jgi:uncharacterized membrane protein YbhN (UPF0104 family)